jgi:hypothetical protein
MPGGHVQAQEDVDWGPGPKPLVTTQPRWTALPSEMTTVVRAEYPENEASVIV